MRFPPFSFPTLMREGSSFAGAWASSGFGSGGRNSSLSQQQQHTAKHCLVLLQLCAHWPGCFSALASVSASPSLLVPSTAASGARVKDCQATRRDPSRLFFRSTLIRVSPSFSSAKARAALRHEAVALGWGEGWPRSLPRCILFLPLWCGSSMGSNSRSGTIMGSILYATGSNCGESSERGLSAVPHTGGLQLLYLRGGRCWRSPCRWAGCNPGWFASPLAPWGTSQWETQRQRRWQACRAAEGSWQRPTERREGWVCFMRHVLCCCGPTAPSSAVTCPRLMSGYGPSLLAVVLCCLAALCSLVSCTTQRSPGEGRSCRLRGDPARVWAEWCGWEGRDWAVQKPYLHLPPGADVMEELHSWS